MTVSAAEARGRILADLAAAIAQLDFGTACLGEAYEQLDDANADRLEQDLFRPLQRAYARAKRTQSGFAARFGLRAPALASASPGIASQGAQVFVTRAATAATEADRRIADLQDSMLPIEAGDPELRAGLAEVREQLTGVPAAAAAFQRTFGR
jgi:hypothetical protein